MTTRPGAWRRRERRPGHAHPPLASGHAHATPRGAPVALAVLLAVAVVVGAALAPSADARSVHDPDTGWPAALRHELGLRTLSPRPCRARTTKAVRRRESLLERNDPRNRLYTIFHDRPHENMWGNLWSTNCDGGRLQVGVASTGTPRNTRRAVARARRSLRKRGLQGDVRLVAVRSTYRQLLEASDALTDAFPTQSEAGLVSPSVDPSRNALDVEVGGKATADDRRALRAAAAASPVNVLLRFEPPPDPNAPIPTYAAPFAVDRAQVRRDAREVAITVADPSCAADETYDTASRLAGVSVRRDGHAFVLTARLRANPDWPEASTCVGHDDPRLTVTTTVVLPGPLGARGIVDGSGGVGGTRPVVVPPVGAKAIRSLVPRFAYEGDDCDGGPVRRAFRGRRKTEWCSF